MLQTVKGTGSHSVDIADGRTVAPGDIVEDLDLDDPVNKGLVDDGFLTVVVTESDEKPTRAPRMPHNQDKE